MHCGADPQHAMPVRLCESAWHSAFMHNMFIRSDRVDLSEHTPEFTILHAPTMLADAKKDGVNSEVFVAISFSKGIVLIAGTRYAGEIKKSIFTIIIISFPPAVSCLCTALRTHPNRDSPSSASQGLERRIYLPIQKEPLLAMMSMAGRSRSFQFRRRMLC